jgi:uncharacterized protein
MNIDEKYDRLISFIKSKGYCAVAFSGGVDSSFLCHAAHEAVGDKAIAITVVSPMLPKSEISAAKNVAEEIGLSHYLIVEDEIDDDVAKNPKDRCYHCKKIEFRAIMDEARKHGVHTVFDGSNLDDLGDYRPGLKALAELKIDSPLREAQLTKNEIRELSKRFKLPTWNKPAFACLASRIPYGDSIDRDKLSRIEKAEEVLREKGFVQFRVRLHGNIARLEVAPDERKKFFDDDVLDSLALQIKSLGFNFVAFELSGYKMGALNIEGIK